MHLWYRLKVWEKGLASWISWDFSQSESLILFNIFPLLTGENVHILIQCLKNGQFILSSHEGVKPKVDGHWWNKMVISELSKRPAVNGPKWFSEFRSFENLSQSVQDRSLLHDHPFKDRPNCTTWVLSRLSARFNKGVTENETQSQFWLSRSYLISCGSFIANFEPALKSRIFEIAILKISTVLYHVKITF